MISRIPVGLAILAGVTGMAVLTNFAGESPMPSNVVQRTPNEAIEMLASGNSNEAQQAKEVILEERRELISELSAIISDPQNRVQRRDAVEKAMSLLGELRAPEGVKVLVAHIGFPRERDPETGELAIEVIHGGMFAKTIDELLPAVGALIDIGEPCIDEVIKKLSTTDDLLEIKACQTVLQKLNQPPSVRARLERAIGGAAPRKQDQLKKTLQMLDLPVAPRSK